MTSVRQFVELGRREAYNKVLNFAKPSLEVALQVKALPHGVTHGWRIGKEDEANREEEVRFASRDRVAEYHELWGRQGLRS